MSEIDFEKLKAEFESRTIHYRNLESIAEETIKDALEIEDIKYHSTSSRVKTTKSFIDKVKRKETEDPFNDITDIVGLRVICLFRSDIEVISKVIRSTFDIVSEENKLESEITTFGYMAVHFIAKLKSSWAGPKYDIIKNIPFEIQIMTIAMNAWSSISHHLEYKKDEDIPLKFKKDFYALSGLLYTADSQFERFYQARNESIEDMKKRTTLLEEPIHLDSLSAYMEVKFPDRLHVKNVYSKLIENLKMIGVNAIRDLDEIVNKSYDAMMIWEKDIRSDGKPAFFDFLAIIVMCDLVGKILPHMPRVPNAHLYRKYVK